VYYDIAASDDVYVDVKIPAGTTISNEVKLAIQNIVLGLQTDLTIGVDLTSAMVTQALAGFTGCTIVDADVGLSSTPTGRIADVADDQYGLLALARITVTALT
jgi:hypothetical protein